MMEDITNYVREALQRAEANGYSFSPDTAPGTIAYDLIRYDSELENVDFQEVASAVNIVRLTQPTTTVSR